MAVIENVMSRDAAIAYLKHVDRGGLIGTQLVQRGALHAVEFLLQKGCSAEIAEVMKVQLVDQLMVIHGIARERGIELVSYMDESPLERPNTREATATGAGDGQD